jgi:hypothetical protein
MRLLERGAINLSNANRSSYVPLRPISFIEQLEGQRLR